MEGLSLQTVARDGHCLLRSFSLLLEDKNQYNRLTQTVVQYVYVLGNDSVHLFQLMRITNWITKERLQSVHG
jgi:hypothetical protein